MAIKWLCETPKPKSYKMLADEEYQLEEFLNQPENLRICPFHDQPLEDENGYVKCWAEPCLIVCQQDQVERYMREIYKNVNIDVFAQSDELRCCCGYLPALSQSNPGRMYLHCRCNNHCKFFRWADLPLKQ